MAGLTVAATAGSMAGYSVGWMAAPRVASMAVRWVARLVV